MEEQALYRAILSSPHDDTARLVYADWLDENADRFPEPEARLERGRAELIRLQCRIARRGPGGWRMNAAVPIDPALEKRQKRLRFLYSAKLRKGLPPTLAGHPFDRGFFRPSLALCPHEFLRDPVAAPGPRPLYDPVPAVPPEHPVRRYVPGDDPFAAFPLWDVHLYAWAVTYRSTEWADRGQYGELLARCARAPALERVGWLKVSFFRTSTVEFFRTGNFANVETLILNCVPFPEVLEAVVGNESFRSLRYIGFGDDDWAWGASEAARDRLSVLEGRVAAANERHLPHGEMRSALRAILSDLPPLPAPPLPPLPAPVQEFRPFPLPPVSAWTPAPAPEERPSGCSALWGVLVLLSLVMRLAFSGSDLRSTSDPPPIQIRYDPNLDRIRDLNLELDKIRERGKQSQPTRPLTHEELMKKYGIKPPKGASVGPTLEELLGTRKPAPEVAPRPREVPAGKKE